MLKPRAELSAEELNLWMRDQMAHYKVPKSITFVEELPKTAANKVDKKLLFTQYGELHLRKTYETQR